MNFRISNVSTFLLTLFYIGIISVSAAKADDFVAEEVNISAQALFVPNGFDDNDEVTVILDGYLPDPCHRLTDPEVIKNNDTKLVTVQAKALLFKGECPDVIVPFTQEVKVGRLEKGEYLVLSKDGRHKERMQVAPAQYPYPDDYMYAAVEKVTVKNDSPHKFSATLEGRLTNSCLKLQKPKVIPTGKTVQVLPIMDYVKPTDPAVKCQRIEKPFSMEVEIPEPAKAGRYLLHVRSLNGQAVNEVFQRPIKN